MTEALRNGGYYFLRNVGQDADLYENKWTGALLKVLWRSGRYERIDVYELAG